MTNHPLIAPKPMPVSKTTNTRAVWYQDLIATLSPIGGSLLLITLATLVGQTIQRLLLG